MANIEFIAVIENGKIIPPAGMFPYFKAHHNKIVKITLSENIKKRSLSQNSFYWGIIVPEVRQFRMDNGDTVSTNQAHEDLMAEFSPQVASKNLKGETIWRAMRTHEMNTKQMSDYSTAIIVRLGEFGYNFPMEGEAVSE